VNDESQNYISIVLIIICLSSFGIGSDGWPHFLEDRYPLIGVSAAPEEWSVRLVVRVDGYRESRFFGLRDDATSGFDLDYDLAVPPDPPVGISAYFSYPDNLFYFQKMASSYLESAESASWELKIKPIGVSGEVTVSWSLSEVSGVPDGYSLRLSSASASVNMRVVDEFSWVSEQNVLYSLEITFEKESSSPPPIIIPPVIPDENDTIPQEEDPPVNDTDTDADPGGVVVDTDLMNASQVAYVLIEADLVNATRIVSEMNVSTIVEVTEELVKQNYTAEIATILLNIDDESSAEVLLEISPESGSRIIEDMYNRHGYDTAYIVETAVKLSLNETDVNKTRQALHNLSVALESIPLSTLVDLLTEISRLPETPSTVAVILEAINTTIGVEAVEAWIATGNLLELSEVLGWLSPKTLDLYYRSISVGGRLSIRRYLSVDTVLSLPNLSVFNVTHLSVNVDYIEAGDRVVVSSFVNNVGGDHGEQTVYLIVNGSLVQETSVFIRLNETEKVDFITSFDEPGTYSLKSGNIIRIILVAEHIPEPNFSFENLVITPPEIEPSETVRVHVTVLNEGDPGSLLVKLEIDNAVFSVQNVSVNSRQRKIVTFIVDSMPTGDHDVKIGELTGTFSVRRRIVIPSWVLYSVIGLVIALGALILLRDKIEIVSEEENNVDS